MTAEVEHVSVFAQTWLGHSPNETFLGLKRAQAAFEFLDAGSEGGSELLVGVEDDDDGVFLHA